MLEVFTVGHSNHPLDEFVRILTAHGITLLVDIRSVPRSRHNPHFNRDALPAPLQAAGIGYLHMAGLGGLRHPRKDSPNTAWKNDSFRGYADYMLTPPFAESLAHLIELAGKERVAIMCAESLPWRCHRSLVADALTARGIPVYHLMSATQARPHTLTSFAHVEGITVTYPGAQLIL